MQLNIEKYGEWIIHNGKKYLLTNYRAAIYDCEQYGVDIRRRFNTEEECEIIKKHFKVFLYKVDLPTRSQMVRHRISWQELSRRYVSGSRVPFEYYLSEKLKDFSAEIGEEDYDANQIRTSIQRLISYNQKMYNKMLEAGIKPQEARRIIPQAAYTQIWGAFMPKQLDNYFKLRLDESSQWEIRQTAIAMQELINKENEHKFLFEPFIS